MIKIHSNIIIGSPSDLAQIINSVHYIINCSTNLNNIIVHPNYLNLNITQFTTESLNILNSVYDFVNNKILLNQNVFLLCDSGIGNSLIVGMFFIMKLLNLNYYNTYYNIATYNKINSYEFYAGLTYYEPYIIKNGLGEKMDIS